MAKYKIKKPVFDLNLNEERHKVWHATNIVCTVSIEWDIEEKLPYHARYCFIEYFNEDDNWFATFEEAENWLTEEIKKYILPWLDADIPELDNQVFCSCGCILGNNAKLGDECGDCKGAYE